MGTLEAARLGDTLPGVRAGSTRVGHWCARLGQAARELSTWSFSHVSATLSHAQLSHDISAMTSQPSISPSCTSQPCMSRARKSQP